MHDSLPLLNKIAFPAIRRTTLATLQVNLGYRCNQACLHCHVNAGPTRREMMDRATIDEVLAFIRRSQVSLLDLTGGAPELNPHFCYLVREARALGCMVMDRCNLTILEEPGQENLADFLAAHEVQITASLPCYLEDNVDAQRGNGVFQASIRGLKQLNALGYGHKDQLPLNLVYNPQGPVLPPNQVALEADYHQHLHDEFGVVFSHLFALANLPINRFGSTLISRGQFDDYMHTLRQAHRPENLATVMCRSLISVDWQGHVYDCDFNQMLHLPLAGGSTQHLRDLDPAQLENRPICVRGHCYGCTAGQGSSCGGALEQAA